MDAHIGDKVVIRDLLSNIEMQARGMWRFRWPALIVAWVVSAVGWSSVYMMPNVYEASARIYVDTENVIRPLLEGIASSSDVMSEVTVVTRELLSRPNLELVARQTDLDLRAKTDEDFENLLNSLQDRIQVVGSRDNIFSIAFKDSNRQTAVNVVESLVDTFVADSLGGNRNETSQAQVFLQAQIAEYEERLTEAEDDLADFKRENFALMPSQGEDYFSRLQAARSALEAGESRLNLALRRRQELLRQLEGEEPVFGIVSATPAGGTGGSDFESAKIRELEQQLEELRLQYTDKHPRIGQILETIELLKKQQADALSVANASGGPGPNVTNPLDLNPVYQNMRIQLTNTDVEIAALREETNQQRREVDELRQLVDTVPQVEAQFNRLNRDYDVVKTKYEQLVQQLETASIGEDVEQSIDEVKFRIIEPPFAGLNPAGPKRQLFLAGILIVAVGLGGALAFLLNIIRPVFLTGKTVTSVTGLPVLGTVKQLFSPADERARRAQKLRAVSALSALVFVFVLLSVFANSWSYAVRNIVGVVS